MIPKTLVDCLELGATRFPLRTAIIRPDATSITYAEMNQQASALASYLSRSGVGRGHRVGVMMPKSAEAIIALCGIMKAGAAYVPIDPSAPAARSERIMNDAQLHGFIVESRNLPSLLNAQCAANSKIVIVVGAQADLLTAPAVSYEAVVESGPNSFPSAAETTDVAYLMYTSGSTGEPKGVMITHENAIVFVNWYAPLIELNCADKIGGMAPLFFDVSVCEMFPPLLHGASLCLLPDRAGVNPKELAALIADRRLTVFSSSPSALALLAQFGELQHHDASSLRLVHFIGEVFPIKHLRELKRQWPKPVYWNLYGPTETAVASTGYRIPDTIPAERDSPYPIGFAAPYCQTLILDAQRQKVKNGEEGLLHISGPSVSPGYWNRPVENAAAFFMLDGQRWYNTGDWVRWDDRDGFIYLGRKDRMVKRRAYRIELDEIEKAFYQHPRVREAAVISTADAEGSIRIIAFLTLKPGDPIALVDWKMFCSSKLPVYMSPDQFVFQDRLPRTASDKVDYQALKQEILTKSGS